MSRLTVVIQGTQYELESYIGPFDDGSLQATLTNTRKINTMTESLLRDIYREGKTVREIN
jgi:hypothetical protein